MGTGDRMIRARAGRFAARAASGLLGLACGAAPLEAGTIRYEADANRIRVSDFPEERPATLDDILSADRQNGWDRIRFAPDSDTYTLDAALWIGASDDWGTFFRIGRPERPRETLLVRGDLVVTPPRPSALRSDGRFRISNRLTLGDPARPNIRPEVRLACSRRGEYAVRVLAEEVPPPPASAANRTIGEWFMAHARVAPADPAHPYAAAIVISHAGVNFRMAESTFSGWIGDLFTPVFTPYSATTPPAERVMRGMVFEQGGTVRYFSFLECVFRGLDAALTHGGATRCVFDGNRRNLALHANHTGAILLDCTIGPPELSLRLPPTKQTSLRQLRVVSATRHARDPAVLANPGVLECASLPVQVVDGQGRPVPLASVWLECPAEPDGAAVLRDLAVTDRDGLTPPPGHDQALVLVTREWRPTDRPEAPQLKTYHYRLRIEAPGYVPAELSLDGVADRPRPLVVTLNTVAAGVQPRRSAELDRR